MTRSQCLRFSSELDLDRLRSDRGERAALLHPPERDVLAAVLELLRRHPKIAMSWRMNTGSGYLLRADQYHRLVAAGHIRAEEARFMRFGFPGCSDIVGMLRKRPGERVGAFLALEVKSETGEPTEEQAAFLEAVAATGGCAGVVRSIDEAHRLIEEFWQR